MRLEFQVYHDYDAAAQSISGLIHQFDAEREEHEYHCFPTTLRLYAPSVDISMSCRRSEGRKGLVVTLISTLPQEDIVSALERVLVRQNTAIPGLCLVATRIS